MDKVSSGITLVNKVFANKTITFVLDLIEQSEELVVLACQDFVRCISYTSTRAVNGPLSTLHIKDFVKTIIYDRCKKNWHMGKQYKTENKHLH